MLAERLISERDQLRRSEQVCLLLRKGLLATDEVSAGDRRDMREALRQEERHIQSLKRRIRFFERLHRWSQRESNL